MTWKDIIFFSILVLGFIVIILSIILNDKTPMYILQDIYLIVLLSIIPARRAFHWIKKVSNSKKIGIFSYTFNGTVFRKNCSADRYKNACRRDGICFIIKNIKKL